MFETGAFVTETALVRFGKDDEKAKIADESEKRCKTASKPTCE